MSNRRGEERLSPRAFDTLLLFWHFFLCLFGGGYAYLFIKIGRAFYSHSSFSFAFFFLSASVSFVWFLHLYFRFSAFSCTMCRRVRVCLCACSTIRCASSGLASSRSSENSVSCQSTFARIPGQPATLSSSTWLYSSFLIMILWFTGVSFSIHGFLIADRSPEVRCSPLRFVMLSRQNWVVRNAVYFSGA